MILKKLIFILVITLLFVNLMWDVIRGFYYFYAPPNHVAAPDAEVIMYGTAWCGYCAKTRVLLEKHDITYFEYDIETSQEGYNQYVDLGGRGVPVLQIGGKVVNGYDPAEILKLVNINEKYLSAE